MTPSPERHEPSTEAIEAVATLLDDSGLTHPQIGPRAALVSRDLLLAAYAIDAPRIAAQARAETVAEMGRAIDHAVAITVAAREGPRFGATAHEMGLYDKGYDDALDHVRSALQLIEAEFGTEGGEHG